VSRPTIEEQLGKVRHRIEELHASGDVPRLRRHLALVDDVEHRVALLQARLDVVDRSLGADASGDPATYIAAVSAELESWDTFLERLQATIATRAWQARDQAEAEIRDVRSRRIAVDERRRAPGAGARCGRQRVARAQGARGRRARSPRTEGRRPVGDAELAAGGST